MTDLELQEFYEDFVRRLRSQGVLCAITSGLACVHYGIAETTKDCDLLCHTSSFGTLLDLLEETRIDGQPCRYRGNISPPLDARWHRGGWTSHFEWEASADKVRLDVFGHALRESKPWVADLLGFYAGPNTVAEMKRTNRDKDWPFITSLGVRMVEADNDDGWLHIFERETLLELLGRHPCPPEAVTRRPALRLAQENDPRLAGALLAERLLWEELDRHRIQLMGRFLRPYVNAVRKAVADKELDLMDNHKVRMDCAENHLPKNPLKDHGLDRYVIDCRIALAESHSVHPDVLQWLPEVTVYFDWLRK